MKELLRKIYDDVLVYEKETISASKSIDEEIHRITEQYKEQLHGDELEELRDLISSMALTAKQSGFETGVRFMLRLLYAGISS